MSFFMKEKPVVVELLELNLWGRMTQTLYAHMNKKKELNLWVFYTSTLKKDFIAFLFLVSGMACSKRVHFGCLEYSHLGFSFRRIPSYCYLTGVGSCSQEAMTTHRHCSYLLIICY
jgi:hypothetical protein